METVAHQIREARRSARLSQMELARAARTSQPAIARYERGITTPSPLTLKRLLSACVARRRPSEVLLAHRDEVINLLRQSGANEIFVFGSVARGEDDEKSDIDLLVDYLDPSSYHFLVPAVREQIEDLLGVSVDIAEERMLKQSLLAEVLADARPL